MKYLTKMDITDKLDLAFGRNTPTYHDIYFSISGINGYNTIINTDKDLIDSDFFEGNLLEDNITEEKTIPTELGLYRARLKIHSHQCNYPLDPIEYDCVTSLEDVELLHKTLILE